MWILVSWDGTLGPCNGSTESLPLDRQGTPCNTLFLKLGGSRKFFLDWYVCMKYFILKFF